jgi:hypothetical protein
MYAYMIKFCPAYIGYSVCCKRKVELLIYIYIYMEQCKVTIQPELELSCFRAGPNHYFPLQFVFFFFLPRSSESGMGST